MSAALAHPFFSSAVVASPNIDLRKQVLEVLDSERCNVLEAHGGAEALAKLEEGHCQALLLDSWLPDLDMSEFLRIVKERYPQVQILIMDAQAVAGGGPVPWLASLRDVLERHENSRPALSQAGTTAESDASLPEPLPGMIGLSRAMQNVYRLSRLVAPRATTVLLTGETGTGKELVAKAIHLLSPRQKQPFITVNCAAIPEALLEAELFGYARGAFTGAFQSRMGRIHAAHGGTLFLDEVGDLPLNMQAKLLRFLQEGEVQRLGGPDVVRVDVRVIAATNAQLAQRITEKGFREDLYYRVSVFPIDLIALRERTDDILTLGNHFLRVLCEEDKRPRKAISESAGKMLEKHAWPGNVRELQHVMERAFILSESEQEILAEHISL
ncbi:MAG: sigma-54-dependent transcriptional regulator [Terriglobia bacterium]